MPIGGAHYVFTFESGDRLSQTCLPPPYVKSDRHLLTWFVFGDYVILLCSVLSPLASRHFPSLPVPLLFQLSVMESCSIFTLSLFYENIESISYTVKRKWRSPQVVTALSTFIVSSMISILALTGRIKMDSSMEYGKFSNYYTISCVCSSPI